MVRTIYETTRDLLAKDITDFLPKLCSTKILCIDHHRPLRTACIIITWTNKLSNEKVYGLTRTIPRDQIIRIRGLK